MKGIFRILKTSVARKMMMGFLLVIVPTVLLGWIACREGLRVASKEIANSHENALSLLSDQLADRLYNMDMLASALLLDDDLMQIAGMQGARIDLYDYVLFRNKMNLYWTPNFLDNDMAVFLPRQGWIISAQSGIRRIEQQETQAIQNTPQKTTWRVRDSLLRPGKKCLSVYRGFVYDSQTSPFTLLEVPWKEMEDVLTTMAANTHVRSVFFLDSAGQIIFTSGADDALHDQILQRAGGSGGEPLLAADGSRLLLLIQDVGSYPCRIGLLLDESDLYSPLMRMQTILVAFMIFAAIASALFIAVATRQLFAPVRTLTDAMQALEKGDLNVRVDTKVNSEFALMAGQFNRTVEQLNNMIREAYVNQLKLKNAQLRYLRSQINPHFLYNSLFSLYNMIQAGDLDSAAHLAVYLGKNYQRSAHLEENDLTVAEELQNIDVYLHIMALRFPDRLQLETDVQSEAKGIRIPVLSLQTLVENAVLHGMEGTCQACVVTIRILVQDDVLVLCVEDTGNGIDPGQLERIREQLKRSADAEDRHGLENVFMRFRLMYGEGVRMSVENREPKGARVSVIVPLGEEGAHV